MRGEDKGDRAAARASIWPAAARHQLVKSQDMLLVLR